MEGKVAVVLVNDPGFGSKDTIFMGYGQSELGEYAEEAAKAWGRYVVTDPQPERGYFFPL
jgi:hypothetical protein